MKITVGMSGGVDSSVTALLLKEQGHELTGVFMKNWQDDDQKFCSAEEDYADVRSVCEQIDIPYYTFNFEEEYWQHVFQLFLDAFKKGYTPNPDILCNKEIKFKYFLKKALASGAEKIATGHYARVRESETGKFELLKGLDENKDQSYFLCLLGQDALSRTLFPIGELEKDKVRELAKEAALAVHSKKDSTGICFIGERKFNEFLSQFLPAQPGDIVDLEGNVLGQHKGTMYYTIGQRKGIGIGGPGEPLFVVDTDVEKNLVIVARGEENSALYHQYLTAEEFHWISDEAEQVGWQGTAKVRYRQQDQEVELIRIEDHIYTFRFKEPQRAITPGQQIVLYDGEVCLGGGVIRTRFNEAE